MSEVSGRRNRKIIKKNNPVEKNVYSLKKRLPVKRTEGPNVVYVTRKTNFKSQLERCCEILRKENVIILQALGAAVQRCCNLALQLKKEFHGVCDFEVNTSTTALLDDFEPMTDDDEYDSQVRQNSSIHIRIFRIGLLIPK